jgi:hypothetical protein
MKKDDVRFGRVSLGLDGGFKARLLLEALKRKRVDTFTG